MMSETHHRKIRSFVRRPGRMTAAQQRALDALMPKWGIPFAAARRNLVACFGRDAPRVLDIGFGNGEALVTAAANHPHIDYLGIEVHEPGIGHLLLLLERAGIENVRVIARDAVEVVEQMLDDEAFDAVNLFFPDPWPKKRHHKRRIVQPPFVAELARVLRQGGLLHIATDWAPYAEHAAAVVGDSPYFVTEPLEKVCNNALAFRPPTKFERRGRRLGHEVADLYFRRVARGADAEDEGGPPAA